MKSYCAENEENRKNIEDLLITDVEKGDYRLHRSVFTDEEIFDLEMKHIFEGNWVYIGHESQIAEKNDYMTTFIGRQSIIISRDRNNELNAFINSCTHRGAQLCRNKKGNKSTYTCPFHGWTYSNAGKLLKVKDQEEGGYPDSFNKDGCLKLQKIARFESYRGFLFGSLSDDVVSLEDHLGGSNKIIDMMVDQSEKGLEVIKGSSTYTLDGNWKVQIENGADGYHVSTVHWNYVATNNHRKESNAIKPQDGTKFGKLGGGVYNFEHGHIIVWSKWEDPTTRPNYSHLEEYTQKFGKDYAEWMVSSSRNLGIYPNVYLMDQFSTQIRIVRPISVNKTEITIFCIAPIGESAENRALRIRQYEDFFNATGMATPDDLEEFRACQVGFEAAALEWNDMSRGAKHRIEGADETAKKIGLKPIQSGPQFDDDSHYVGQHEYWLEAMQKAIKTEKESK